MSVLKAYFTIYFTHSWEAASWQQLLNNLQIPIEIFRPNEWQRFNSLCLQGAKAVGAMLLQIIY